MGMDALNQKKIIRGGWGVSGCGYSIQRKFYQILLNMIYIALVLTKANG